MLNKIYESIIEMFPENTPSSLLEALVAEDPVNARMLHAIIPGCDTAG